MDDAAFYKGQAEKQARFDLAASNLREKVGALATLVDSTCSGLSPHSGTRRGEPFRTIIPAIEEVVYAFTLVQEAVGLPEGEEAAYSLFKDKLGADW